MPHFCIVCRATRLPLYSVRAYFRFLQWDYWKMNCDFIGNCKGKVCLQLHGQKPRHPMCCLSAMLDQKDQSFVMIQVLFYQKSMYRKMLFQQIPYNKWKITKTHPMQQDMTTSKKKNSKGKKVHRTIFQKRIIITILLFFFLICKTASFFPSFSNIDFKNKVQKTWYHDAHSGRILFNKQMFFLLCPRVTFGHKNQRLLPLFGHIM